MTERGQEMYLLQNSQNAYNNESYHMKHTYKRVLDLPQKKR